jgi:hypothetical protein
VPSSTQDQAGGNGPRRNNALEGLDQIADMIHQIFRSHVGEDDTGDDESYSDIPNVD